jgi:putative nucleotidyltransferase with HDIG domain
MEKEQDGLQNVELGAKERSVMSNEELPLEVVRAQIDLLEKEHTRGNKVAYFVDYLDPELSLEDRLAVAFDELQIKKEQQDKISKYLALLELKHKETLYHSIRVGLAAKGIAKHMKLDEKALLYAGLLHDVGKSMVPLSTLSKTEGWTDKDTEAMDEHVAKSYELLRDTFDFSAEIVAQHHLFQAHAYPAKPLQPLHEHTVEIQKAIESDGRILALADVYDALHRVNEKFGGLKTFSGEQVKEQMLRMNPDQVELIEELYDAGVFTLEIFPKKEGM